MNPLSQTRSARALTHLLQTPDTFVRTPVPSVERGMVIVHASPELGAAFLQYTVELEAGGRLLKAQEQRFFYVLEGMGNVTVYEDPATRTVLSSHELRPGSYAYLPPLHEPVLVAASGMRVAVIEKRYVGPPQTLSADFRMPDAFVAHEDDVAATPLNGDAELLVRSLLPAGLDFDFAVNTMSYAANAALSQVEIHYMEHGLLMLAGAGPYRLGETFHEVRAGDFIWMAPYCPQWFQASEAGPAKYLIYKNFNRMPAL